MFGHVLFTRTNFKAPFYCQFSCLTVLFSCRESNPGPRIRRIHRNTCSVRCRRRRPRPRPNITESSRPRAKRISRSSKAAAKCLAGLGILIYCRRLRLVRPSRAGQATTRPTSKTHESFFDIQFGPMWQNFDSLATFLKVWAIFYFKSSLRKQQNFGLLFEMAQILVLFVKK